MAFKDQRVKVTCPSVSLGGKARTRIQETRSSLDAASFHVLKPRHKVSLVVKDYDIPVSADSSQEEDAVLIMLSDTPWRN